MRVFVTGLCLQGNKGGPAIALSLMDSVRKEIPDVEFVLAVPPAPQFEYEKRWAALYGVTVVEDLWSIGLWSLNPVQILRDGLGATYRRIKQIAKWYSALRSCDLVLDMTAISYVGPPEGSEIHALGTRYRYFRAARFTGRKFFAWTQSYGPFSTPAIAKAAREDLSTLPVVYCRGEQSRKLVQELIPGKACKVYPDVAVVLDYDLGRGRALVDGSFETAPDRPLITVSPSAVIFDKCEKTAGADNFHVQSMAQLCQDLIERGFAVLLVPHTFHPAIHIPTQCDYAVCLEILSQIRPNRWLGVIHSDISAVDLKSVIANAHIHIGARYHSVVAGLSTGTPSISVSWHHKYGDIMEMYGVRDLVVDGNEPTFNEHTLGLVAEIRSNYDDMVRGLQNAQGTLADQIADNARHFASLFRRPESDRTP